MRLMLPVQSATSPVPTLVASAFRVPLWVFCYFHAGWVIQRLLVGKLLLIVNGPSWGFCYDTDMRGDSDALNGEHVMLWQ